MADVEADFVHVFDVSGTGGLGIFDCAGDDLIDFSASFAIWGFNVDIFGENEFFEGTLDALTLLRLEIFAIGD